MSRRSLADFAVGWGIVIACIPIVVFAGLFFGKSHSDQAVLPVPDDRARKVAEAAPFTVGDFSVASGWKLTQVRGKAFQVEGVTVKNTDTKSRRAFFTLTLLDHGALVTTINCSTEGIAPRHTGEADCADTTGGDHHAGGFDTIRVEPTF